MTTTNNNIATAATEMKDKLLHDCPWQYVFYYNHRVVCKCPCHRSNSKNKEENNENSITRLGNIQRTSRLVKNTIKFGFDSISGHTPTYEAGRRRL
jgi:hypothetical protein